MKPKTAERVHLRMQPPVTSKYSWFEIYSTIVAAVSFLCIGLLRAYTSPAILSMNGDPEFFETSPILQKEVISWVASSPPLASFVGTIFSGPLLQYCGRRKTLILLNVPSVIGWGLIGFAQNVYMVLAGRTLTGFAAGISTAAAQLYVSECVRPEVRGTLGFLPAMMLALGILAGFSASTIDVEWQALALILSSVPMLLLLMSITIPESPTWLIINRKESQALKSIVKLRGNTADLSTIEDEVEVLKSTALENQREENSQENGGLLSKIINLTGQRSIWLPAFIATFLMIFQQFSGANVVIYYLSVILAEAEPKLMETIQTLTSEEEASFLNSTGYQTHVFNASSEFQFRKSSLSHNLSSVIVGVVQFLAFFLSLPLIDRMGRRILLIGSAILMALPFALLGFYFRCKDAVDVEIEYFETGNFTEFIAADTFSYAFITMTYTWLPLTCLCVFISAYSIGFGPVPFIIMSEIFPSHARGYLCSLTSFVNHLALFVVIKMFPLSLDGLGASWTFWGFAFSSLISVGLVILAVPETKGKSLDEIERQFKSTREVIEPLMKVRKGSHARD